MIIIGLIFMALATAAVAGVVVSSTDSVPVQVFGHSAHSHQIGVVFLAGAVAGLLFAIGFRLLSSGLTRGSRRRAEVRRAERARAAESQSLRQRNAQLEAALASDGNGSESVDVTDSARTGRHAHDREYAEPGTDR